MRFLAALRHPWSDRRNLCSLIVISSGRSAATDYAAWRDAHVVHTHHAGRAAISLRPHSPGRRTSRDRLRTLVRLRHAWTLLAARSRALTRSRECLKELAASVGLGLGAYGRASTDLPPLPSLAVVASLGAGAGLLGLGLPRVCSCPRSRFRGRLRACSIVWPTFSRVGHGLGALFALRRSLRLDDFPGSPLQPEILRTGPALPDPERVGRYSVGLRAKSE